MTNKNILIVRTVLEGQFTPAEAAHYFGVSRRWVYELLRRYRTQGDQGPLVFSKRPASNPQATNEPVRTRIIALRQGLSTNGLDAGAATIAWHLNQEGLPVPALSTIYRILREHGLVVTQPQKRPRSAWKRFEATQPNETWQSDFTHWALADGSDTEILNFLDDHSRYLLYCTAYHRITGPIVVQRFLDTAQEYGLPASTLTDNGMVYTTRLAGGRGGLNSFEQTLHTLKVVQKNGKQLTPGPGSTEQTSLTINPHYRIRTDIIDATGKTTIRYGGKLFHLGIGRRHAGSAIKLLAADKDIIAIKESSGEILGEFTIDVTKNYQPKRKNP